MTNEPKLEEVAPGTPKTLTAVECEICHNIHHAGRDTYVTFVGSMYRPAIGDGNSGRQKFLGSATNPTVICAGRHNRQLCIRKFLQIGPVDTDE